MVRSAGSTLFIQVRTHKHCTQTNYNVHNHLLTSNDSFMGGAVTGHSRLMLMTVLSIVIGKLKGKTVLIH